MNHPRIHAETEKFIIYRFKYQTQNSRAVKGFLGRATYEGRNSLYSAKNECKVYEEHLAEIPIIPHSKQSKNVKNYTKREFG